MKEKSKINDKNIINDDYLAAEDYRTLWFITLTLLVFSLLYILEMKLDKPIPEYCFDEFCVFVKGEK